MRTEQATGGFALIEVLVAMIILTIGLLGLNALSIMAASNTARSESISQATVSASEALEIAAFQVKSALPVEQRCINPQFQDGDRVSLQVVSTAPGVAQITAVVTPRPKGGKSLPSQTIITYATNQNTPAIATTGAACP